ncbi:hypothetical protein D3C80_1452170 [compost metagenome]
MHNNAQRAAGFGDLQIVAQRLHHNLSWGSTGSPRGHIGRIRGMGNGHHLMLAAKVRTFLCIPHIKRLQLQAARVLRKILKACRTALPGEPGRTAVSAADADMSPYFGATLHAGSPDSKTLCARIALP